MADLLINNPFAPKVKGVRGSDRKKLERNWVDVQRVYEFDDGHYIGYVGDAADTATLGKMMGHCAGTHFVWTCEEKIWYFFAIFDKDDVPHGTIHAKQATWVDKPHPRDKCPVYPVALGQHARYGYPSLADTIRHFKDAGLEYEPGKYAASYNSCTYDPYRNGGDPGQGTYLRKYGRAITPTVKPPDVDDAVWEAYVKAGKAVIDNHDKNVGSVKIVGRRIKFDGKWLLILSAHNKSQDGIHGAYSRQIAEWLNNSNKKEKK